MHVAAAAAAAALPAAAPALASQGSTMGAAPSLRVASVAASRATVRDGDKTCLTCGERLGQVELEVSELEVGGLDTITNATLLDTASSYLIGTQLRIGGPTRPLTLSVRVRLGINSSALQLLDDFTLELALRDVQARLRAI